MQRKAPPQPAAPKAGLVIRAASGAPLSRVQVEFNRLMKNLEATKARHTQEQARLDETLATAIRELMPLIERLKRVNRDLVLNAANALHTLKLTAKRRYLLGDLLTGKAQELLADPVGIDPQDITALAALVKKLNPHDPRMSQGSDDERNSIITLMKQVARDAGLVLDLSDLDPTSDPAEIHRIASERLRAAFENKAAAAADTDKPQRKPTKAQAETERKRLDQEQAKNRDLKSLFKQLAKAFHPDLEPDPRLKEHKKIWMQRLNAAYSADDLREMLQLEMEWLGEEATNLATAGDAKLQVYCMVLKQQIADLKRKTHQLPSEPQYGPLQRFRNRHHGTIASPVSIKRQLQSDLHHYQKMFEILSANDAASRRMLYDWADEHAERTGEFSV
jgi:hypothetical protein